ncbi:DUF447 domain-containing protein [Desulfoscipio sp. XC116]|uniref:DUF447 domain-containing protein n=1 Tax=Desulfoscipio sp. XC116 TaxID=3144975 RepID=UPI00325B0C08
MIIETILSSLNEDGEVNFAPIGVHVSDHTEWLSEVEEIEIFLYSGSKTFSNLRARPEGVINLTDDLLSFVDTALYSGILPTHPSDQVRPPRMAGAKLIWEFAVTSFDDSREPAKVTGKILLFRELSSFTGLCRAHGAILEAAITATRLTWIPASKVTDSWPLWQQVVEKTGGGKEKEAFAKITDYFCQQGIKVRGHTSFLRSGDTPPHWE